jgi:hypothetical protein
MGKESSPAKVLEEFLNAVAASKQEYQYAYDAVNEEDRRLQDLLHEMEFAPNKAERNRSATKLQQSRRRRRECKDIVKKNEKLVKFFEEQKNREILNRMCHLLGQQRKEEEYLASERTYKPRMSQEVEGRES